MPSSNYGTRNVYIAQTVSIITQLHGLWYMYILYSSFFLKRDEHMWPEFTITKIPNIL